jgi:osmoprotectant transport system permease protein
MRGFIRLCAALAMITITGVSAVAQERPLTIGSKGFTESVILGEIMTGLAERSGSRADHRRQLGGTRILWNALLSGEIDAYPEYTGTITREILASERLESLKQIADALAVRGISMSAPLGFNNTYAIAVKGALADRLGLKNISDLARHPDLKLGFSNEFMDRGDGWPALRKRYGLGHEKVRGLDHDLAYRALDNDSLEVIDVYTTDAEIPYYKLRLLKDDLAHFPTYQAVILYRSELDRDAPATVAAFKSLAGNIDAARMAALNARVKLDGLTESAVASGFLSKLTGIERVSTETPLWARLARRTGEHLTLVGISLLAAILTAIPLGIAAIRYARAGKFILAVTGMIQTIPGLALLVFMIPLLGIGSKPAIAALFLYSLLPIVRNTHSGLSSIPAALIDSADAMGLSTGARLRMVELPMAAPSIMAGIKTSAVINIGTATLGALIGAGGYGQPILTGIRLDSTALILEGAIPAAALALIAQALFDRLEKRVTPAGLRKSQTPA